MSQLAFDMPPDDRHPWGRRSSYPGRADEWRCDVCGELATRSIADGSWVFLRPQLVTKPPGPWHWAKESHLCEPRAWA